MISPRPEDRLRPWGLVQLFLDGVRTKIAVFYNETFLEHSHHARRDARLPVDESEATSLCCSRAHGYLYSGTVYARYALNARRCPWCVADGSAAERFDATISDEHGLL
jgi:Uncharacterised protein family (UPF0167)